MSALPPLKSLRQIELEAHIAELEAKFTQLEESYIRIVERDGKYISNLEDKLAELKARHCEDCMYWMVCSNEVQTASQEAWTVDFCSRWEMR